MVDAADLKSAGATRVGSNPTSATTFWRPGLVMRFKVVACGVFEPYLRRLSDESSHDIEIKTLDAGLHSRPNDLRLLVQSEIDEASRSGEFDAVILLYGLCGRGTAGLVSRDIPVVIPRAHDCITLFLGSSEAYLRQFHANPGTFYHTLGWIEKKINPKNREASELYQNYELDGYDLHPDFKVLEQKYGAENAEHIVAFLERWKQHYTRAAYIDMGFEDEARYVEFTTRMAEILGWKHETITGDSTLLRSLLSGDWSDSRIFVLPPDSRSTTSGDEKIFAASSIDGDGSGAVLSDSEVIIESGANVSSSSGIGLGIDAGGTYTDAVIYDIGERKLLAKAKSLTTYHDLVVGIRGALKQLPSELLSDVQVTSLSTTLATNSIVEGRGHKVGLIVLTPFKWTHEHVGHRPMLQVPGSVAITGEIIEPLDEDACRAAIEKLVLSEHCAAIVIAGYALVRNPEQANRVREIAEEMFDLPVICAHEVSRRLNSIHAAQTAVANAKLLPVIRRLMDSVHKALSDFRVPGKLMVVKGDGTPVDESIARARPVETILSGPAASVSGARILTGLDDALVLDIGGTTTDCAVFENGRVAVSAKGARIGNSVMGVDAADITTVGLGGDSRIAFAPDRRIHIGPTRNIPLSCLASQYKSVEEFLDNFNIARYKDSSEALALDVLVIGSPGRIEFTEPEKSLLDLLKEGPAPAIVAAEKLGLASPSLLPISRLESRGIVKRSALTPTDLLHVDGRFSKWNQKSAKRALEIFAAMYGRPAEELLHTLLLQVTRRIFEEVVRREVSYENPKLHELPEDWKFLLDKAFLDDGKGLGVAFELRRPVIAIGAPAQALVPEISKHLRSEIIVPEHADVANAIGAIGSEVVVREEILIRPGEMSNYVLHGTEERVEFSELERATERAVEIARARARKLAVEAGARSPEVTVSRIDHLGTISDGGKIFIERRITAVASGGAFGG